MREVALALGGGGGGVYLLQTQHQSVLTVNSNHYGIGTKFGNLLGI